MLPQGVECQGTYPRPLKMPSPPESFSLASLDCRNLLPGGSVTQVTHVTFTTVALAWWLLPCGLSTHSPTFPLTHCEYHKGRFTQHLSPNAFLVVYCFCRVFYSQQELQEVERNDTAGQGSVTMPSAPATHRGPSLWAASTVFSYPHLILAFKNLLCVCVLVSVQGVHVCV